MAYQVLARKWRPKRFDDVVGQRGVTETLRNAITQQRIAQAFVFAGPRGVGKTTTARILARALNCFQGPTPEPCGACDACVEIADGRDIDVLEIDAATHTQVDNVREVIIAGLAMAPVRDRYKIFIIDEVHQLSAHSFNALLKSIEEPPSHVVFMMATTELGKIPDTIQSRAQVYELRTIGTRTIADELRKIAAAEGLVVDEAALGVVARSAEGSLRDALSALDQVVAFATDRVTADDVNTVLGLVGRDLLFDTAQAVADENMPAVFDQVAQAVEAGHDLKQVCRELARLVRDLMLLSIDPARFDDADVAPEWERERLKAFVERFSREDLLRAFDVLSATEADMRASGEPRYHLEMALVKWIHLGRLVPLTDLIEQLSGGSPRPATAAPPPQPMRSTAPAAPPKPAARPAPGPMPPKASAPAAPTAARPAPVPERAGTPAPPVAAPPADQRDSLPTPATADEPRGPASDLHTALLGEIRQSKRFLYNTVVAQARRIDIDGDRITFTFAPVQRALRAQLEQSRPWLESVASRLAGRPMTVATAPSADEAANGGATPGLAEPAAPDPKDGLRERAMADAGVQALLDVFGAEIREVEEIEKEPR